MCLLLLLYIFLFGEKYGTFSDKKCNPGVGTVSVIMIVLQIHIKLASIFMHTK